MPRAEGGRRGTDLDTVSTRVDSLRGVQQSDHYSVVEKNEESYGTYGILRRSSSFFFGMNLRQHAQSAFVFRPSKSGRSNAPAVQHRDTTGEHRDLETVLLLKVLDELLQGQVALDEEAAKTFLVSHSESPARKAKSTYRSQRVNSVSRYCTKASCECTVHR